jgi:hypothetical protein
LVAFLELREFLFRAGDGHVGKCCRRGIASAYLSKAPRLEMGD